MKITDKVVIRELNIVRSLDLEESISNYPERERDGRSDMQFLADEVSYRISLYKEETATAEEYEEAQRFLRETSRNDEFSPCRIVNYEIPVTCLQNYLLEIEDCRTAAEFFETYDSDEAQELYTYAEDDNRILKESVDYSDDFIQEYEKSNYLSREDFFWSVYIKQSA